MTISNSLVSGLSSPLVSGLLKSSAFTPAQLSSLLHWFDSSDTSTITHSSGSVSQLENKGPGQQLDDVFFQEFSSAQPSTGTRTINDLNVLDFDGTDFMAGITQFTWPSAFDVFFVAQVDSITNQFTSIFSVDATNDFQMQGGNPGVTEFNYIINQANISASNIGTTTVDYRNAPHVFGFCRPDDDSVYQTSVDGVIIDEGQYLADVSTSVVARLFTNRSGTNAANGAFCEMIVTDEYLSTSDRNAVVDYLINKWGIT